jgi:hypothetical protein
MKTSYVNFAVGLLYGFGLGVLLDMSSLVTVSTFALLLAFLILIPALVWYESYSHRRRVERWPQIAKQGKLLFISTRYVILRGGILSVMLMFALRDNPPTLIVHEITIPFIAIALGFVGYQEWENCSRDCSIPRVSRREDSE